MSKNTRSTRGDSPFGGKGAVRKPGGAPPAIINQKIEIRPYHRTEQNIPNWRQAIQSAESQIPRRYLLYNLYADVDLDGHVEAVTGKRRDPIKAANWQFVDKEGSPVDEINSVIDTIGFDELLEEIINSRFWGYSILEPKFWKDSSDNWQMDSGLIPRLNYRPEIGVVAYDIHGNEGINIRKGVYAKTVMEIGKVIDLGLYMKAAPYAILKRGGLGDYAAFIQTFGSPLIDAMWDGFDEKQRLQLQQALENIGAGGTIVRPEGTSIEVKENNVNATGDAHGSFLRFCNTEISKALLGTTETTEASVSSGYAQSDTHQEQDDLKHDNDLAYCRKVLNSRFIKILQAYGFDTKGGEFTIQGQDQELTKQESFEIHKGLAKELGVPIDDDFWYERYGVPKPDDYDEMKKSPLAPEGGNEGAKPSGQKSPPRPADTPPKEGNDEETEVELKEKNWFIKLYERFFVTAPAEEAGANQSCGHHHTIKLAEIDGFDNDGLIQRVWDKKGTLAFDGKSFSTTADILIDGFKKGWDEADTILLADAPGFTYNDNDPALLTAFEQNLFRFSGAKSLWEIQQLNAFFRRSTSFAEFYQLGRKFLDRSRKHYLETEYNSALLTGSASATYWRLMAKAETFPYWKYTTAGDNHVRPEHQALDGIILPISDSYLWDRIFPPNGWNCRCYIVPRMRGEVTDKQITDSRAKASAYINSPRFAKETKSGWGFNRAKDQFVFAENQLYAKRFSKSPDALLNDLGAADFGLRSYEKLIMIDKELQKEKIDAGAFFDNLEELDGNKVLRDYHNRPIKVDAKNFERHATDKTKKRGHRAELLHAVLEALSLPEEVWLKTIKKSSTYSYIKAYKGTALKINVKLNGGELELVSWYEIANKPREINSARSGMLIKQ